MSCMNCIDDICTNRCSITHVDYVEESLKAALRAAVSVAEEPVARLADIRLLGSRMPNMDAATLKRAQRTIAQIESGERRYDMKIKPKARKTT